MANQVILSNAFDGNLEKSDDQRASESTKSRVNNQPVASFDDGEYIVVPQKHFNVKTSRIDGTTVNSSRICVVNLEKGYCRTFKVSDLNGTVATIDKIDQSENPLEIETIKDRRDGKTMVKRIKRGQLPRPTRALKYGYLPLITQGDDVVVSVPFRIKINGNLTGFNVAYVEQKDSKGVGTGHYDVELDDNGNVVFNETSYPSFETDSTVKDADVSKAKSIISKDAQMSVLTEGRLQ